MSDDRAWGVEDLTVVLGGHLVVRDVSLHACPGTVAAVVGGDGAGKTTVLRVLCGRITPAAGQVRMPGRRRIGYQPATAGSWANLTVLENLTVVARAYRIDPARLRRSRRDLLVAAGLWEARHRQAGDLSGGMRRKLGFCMAMLHRPSLLVLDEPSTGVDPVSRVELWALISGAAADGAAVVIATSYLDEAERAQQVLVLDHGVPLAHGSPEQVLAATPGTVTTVPAATHPGLAWRRGRTTRQWHPGPPRDTDTVAPTDLEDAVVAMALQHRGTGGVPVPCPAPVVSPGGPLAEAARVSCAFGANMAVQDVTAHVTPGEIVGLIGANGAGKTTLIRMLLGLLEPTAGHVRLFGSPPTRDSRRRVGYVPQGLGLYRDLTAAENVAFVSAAYGRPPAAGAVPAEVAAEPVATLGLGRQRQLAFACALGHTPELLVLDEPTSGVDPIARARLWDTIHGQAEASAGLLVSTHYMQEADQCDRLLLMDGGRVVAEGTRQEIIGRTTVARVRAADWTAAFRVLRAARLPVSLAGREVRVVDTPPGPVAATLRDADVPCRVDTVPATLDEAMIAIAGGSRPPRA